MEFEKQIEEPVVLVTKTLREILQIEDCSPSDNYTPLDFKLSIPDYQRIYCWREKNVIQLLDNLNETNDNTEYHLGSIILHKTKKEDQSDYSYAIVDGQQRLVTLSLILLKLNEHLPNELLNEKFESSEAIHYIGYNKKLINDYLLKPHQLRIENLLDQISISVIIINDGSLDLAYTFFSTQNARGKALTDYDLLKAHHLRFIHYETQAIHLAERWDNLILNSDNDSSEKDLGKTLGLYLFRLRKWMRKRIWSEDEKFKVKNEFEAAELIPEVPPFGEQFYYYESIQGGTHFFAYADHFIYKFKTFTETPEYNALQTHIQGESHWWYRDVIECFLFAYFLKFGTIYMPEALYCIEKIISSHRYGLGRSGLKKVLEHAMHSELIMMIDQATSSTFFLAESQAKIKRLNIPSDLNGIRRRYHDRISSLYNNYINKEISIASFKNCL